MQQLTHSILLSGNEAVAYAVKQCDVDVIAAYPITPQTTIVEKLSKYVADGELAAEFIAVESEHSALSACIGASAAGARVFTATSSQGLALMHEMLYVASGLRLPVVMAIANRALSAPINIHGDHSDIMGSRDSGWIQIFCENVQEAYDRIIHAYRLAEDSRVLLPAAVNIDGFTISHCYEGVVPLDDETVKKFVPRSERVKLDHEQPATFGGFSLPDSYFEIKLEQVRALEESRKVFDEIVRSYPIRRQGLEAVHVFNPDAPVKVISMGSMAGTLRHAVKTYGLRKVGVVSVKLFRPFPKQDILEAVASSEFVAVFDRAISPGGASNPLSYDVKAALYDSGILRPFWNIVYGLGGREVTLSMVKRILEEILTVWESRSENVRTVYMREMV